MSTLVRPASVPTRWQAFAKALWNLPEAEADRLWRALQGARWSESAGFRQRLLLVRTHTPDTIVRYAQEVLTPSAVIATVEALVGEGRLPRRVATTIEEYMFVRVRPDGQWK